MSGEQNCRKKKLLNSDIRFVKTFLSGAEKRRSNMVTSCYHFDTTPTYFSISSPKKIGF